MKKLIISFKTIVLFVACAALLQSCLKDTATRTYSMYVPVYKTFAEVHANIKSNAPQPVKSPGKIFVSGNYIFLNETDKGVHIIDNTNPSSPVNKYFISIPGNLDLAVTGNTLYADNYTDLVTIDISNPNAIQVKKIISKVFPQRQYLNSFQFDTTRVIVDWIKKDTTVADQPQVINWNTGYLLTSVSPAAQSSSVAASSPTLGISGSTARFTLLNNYLYTVTQTDLNVFNISQPQNPVFSNKVNTGWSIETIYPFKNNLFIGSQAGMFIFNTANPAQPQQLSQFTHITACDPVIADDNFAYVTLRTGNACFGTINRLDVVNISNLQNPVQSNSYPLTNPHGLSKNGNTLFVCDGDDGLKVFDASKAPTLNLVQIISGIKAYDVITINNNAIVVAGNGLYQYDFTNPAKVILRSKIAYNE